jgi:flagellar hook protein FlgE
MMRSIISGVSGLRNHQTRMEVIGNNIANVNTVGFKASRVTFKEGFAQILQGGALGVKSGGTNPVQVGLGMNIGAIDVLFTQGSLESTGVNTDLAIEGGSFFVVSDGVQRFYTRAGNFQLDASGRMVAATNGSVLQGRLIDGTGRLTDQIQDIVLPFDQRWPAQATREVTFAGNLNAEAPEGATRDTTITVFDGLGSAQEVRVRFERQAANGTWEFQITLPNSAGFDPLDPPIATGTVVFDSQGRLESFNPENFTFTPDSGADDVEINLNFGVIGGLRGLTQFAGPSTAAIRDQDGYQQGDLARFSIDANGSIFGAFTNGVTLQLGQVALADFNNPGGLIRVGENQYTPSVNSGEPLIGFAGEGSRSKIAAGALEISNVDLAQEFTNLITTQRGFQSNARVISTSDEMLQEVVTLKR